MSALAGHVVEIRSAGQDGQSQFFVFEPRTVWPPQIIEMNGRVYTYAGDSFKGNPRVRVHEYGECPTYLRFMVPMIGSTSLEDALKGARVN